MAQRQPQHIPSNAAGPKPRSRQVRTVVHALGGKVAERYPFDALPRAQLIVDADYESGTLGHRADDALARLFPKRGANPGCGNAGGFRPIGGRAFDDCTMLIVKSSGEDQEWPDHLDSETGIFTYFGDNKKPGCDLTKTSRGGNKLLEDMFDASTVLEKRARTPPVLIFVKSDERGTVRFRGLAVPYTGPDEGLVAIWRQTGGQRFQNYRATFGILKCSSVTRPWLDALQDRDLHTAERHAPPAWTHWIKRGHAELLQAPRTVQHRSRTEQVPARSDRRGREIVEAIRNAVSGTPHDFEFIAAELFRMIEPRVFDIEITRKSADGGRDATGRLRIGGNEGQSDAIYCEFALEAKAYGEDHGVGVADTARLISRLRHRQFGVLVTTSFVGPQAYKEIRSDRHPVVIIAAVDITTILRAQGISTGEAVRVWIDSILARGTARRR